jgi:hypothetical protein
VPGIPTICNIEDIINPLRRANPLLSGRSGRFIAVVNAVVGFTAMYVMAGYYGPAVKAAVLQMAGVASLAAGAGCAFSLGRNNVRVILNEVFENTGLLIAKNGTLLKPLLVKSVKQDYGHYLIFHLPEGICKSDFDKRREEIEAALCAEVEMFMKGRALHMRVMEHQLPDTVPYVLPEDWDERTADMALPIPIGHGRAGLEVLDLAEAPHLLVAGETYGGKSNFLHQAVVTLTRRKNVRLFVVDMAKVEFAYLRRHAWFAHSLGETVRMMRYLTDEMHRRMEVLERAGVEKIQNYRGDDLPYLVLIVDEFSQLSPELAKGDKRKKDARAAAHNMLIDLLCLARKVGIHVVLSTQRPDRDILPGQMKANIPAVVCFKVKNKINSEICLDNDKADRLPRHKGRAIFQFDREREVQVMHLPLPQARAMLPKEIASKPDEYVLQKLPS